MSDTNLDPSISALSTRATEVAASASPRELLNLSRIAPSLEQSENAGLEVAINSRAAGLAPSATATELKSIGKAIGNVLEPDTFTAGAFIPAQLDQSGKFLGTSGTSKNWSGVTVSGLSEVNISDIANDETLVYNNVSSQFENSSQVFNIPQYAQTADLPASATSGATAFDASTAELKYWDGSEWKVAAVVAAAGGGSTTTVDWSGLAGADFTINAPAGYSEMGVSVDIYENTLIVGSTSGAYRAYDTDTGNLLWTADKDPANQVGGGYYSRMTVGGTYWIVKEDDGDVVVRKTSDGSLVKSYNRFSPDAGVDYSGFGGDNWGMGAFGTGTASHGNLIAIGDNNQDRRVVHVFDVSTDTFQYSVLDPEPFTNNPDYGSNIVMNDDYLVVGAPNGKSSNNVERAGLVHIYNVSDGSFVRTIEEPTPFEGADFGGEPGIRAFDVNPSGTKIVIGAPEGGRGRMYLFDMATGAMEQEFIKTSGSEGLFGHSARISGNHVGCLAQPQYTIAIYDISDGSAPVKEINMAPQYSRFAMDGNSVASVSPLVGDGVVSIWNGVETTSGGGSGSTSSTLDLSTISWNKSVNPHTDLEKVATYGDLVVIGVRGHTGFRGKAYLYNKSTDTTTELVQPSADVIAQGNFGKMVAINDTYIAVLAGENSTLGITGKIYLYDHSGVYQNVRIEGPAQNSGFGSSANTGNGVILSDTYIFVLAHNYANDSAPRCYVYDYAGTEIGYLTTSAFDMKEFAAKGNIVLTGSNERVQKWDVSSLSGSSSTPVWTCNVASGIGSLQILDDDYFLYTNYTDGVSSGTAEAGYMHTRQLSDASEGARPNYTNVTNPDGDITYGHFGKFTSVNESGIIAVSGRDLSGKVYLYSHSDGVLTYETSVDASSTGIGATATYGHTISISENSLVVGDLYNGQAHIFD